MSVRSYPRRGLSSAAAALGGALIGIGTLGIFALYGLVPLLLGIAVVVLSLRHSHGTQRLWNLSAAGLATALTIAFLLWGSEHVWANPSCSQHANQVSGRITYWSGASVSWKCVDGRPVITRDSR